MLKKTLISGVAAAAIAMSGAALAQGSGASGSTPTPTPTPSPKASGTAPGLENRTDAPRATPSNERAQERTGTSGAGAGTASPSTGTAPGLQNNRNDVPRGTPTNERAQERTGTSDRTTTGQVPRVEINPKQRTELRTHIKRANIRTVTRESIGVSIAIGAVLPSTVTFAPLPTEVVTIVPQFRGYHAVQVGDQILIIEPGTRRIVYIIEA